jgi:hypothetical protein
MKGQDTKSDAVYACIMDENLVLKLSLITMLAGLVILGFLACINQSLS